MFIIYIQKKGTVFIALIIIISIHDMNTEGVQDTTTVTKTAKGCTNDLFSQYSWFFLPCFVSLTEGQSDNGNDMKKL